MRDCIRGTDSRVKNSKELSCHYGEINRLGAETKTSFYRMAYQCPVLLLDHKSLHSNWNSSNYCFSPPKPKQMFGFCVYIINA